MYHSVFLCLGGNIGNRMSYLNAAIDMINEQIGSVAKKSLVYETEAWGVDNQQAYLNRCIEIKTGLSAQQLIIKLLSIEKQLGRKRLEQQHYQARTIDIDILFYNDDVLETENLIVPHPRLHLRNFVLMPLCDIAPTYKHPVLKKTMQVLLSECTDILEVKIYKN